MFASRQILKTPQALIGLLLLVSGFLSVNVIAAAKLHDKPQDKLSLSELHAFTEAYYQIKSNYVESVDDTNLIRAAINGMVTSLDPHSQFLSPQDYAFFNRDNSGEYAGIGLSFNDHKYGLEVSEVANKSPADRAGLKAGMLVTHINKQAIKFLTAQSALAKLKGKINTSIELTVAAAEFPQPKAITLTREIIVLPSVQSQLLPEDSGYIAISQFTLHTTEEFTAAVEALSVDKPVRKLILDLRDNPGGVLTTAIEISDLFISKGKLLVSRGRTDDANHIYYAKKHAPYAQLEVIILINKGSASASEIVAAALRDHKKAVILGETSYGKGSIQSLLPLNNESAIKLTSAHYLSPKGHKIQDVGISPDIIFTPPQQENYLNVSLLDDPQLLQAYNLLHN